MGIVEEELVDTAVADTELEPADMVVEAVEEDQCTVVVGEQGLAAEQVPLGVRLPCHW